MNGYDARLYKTKKYTSLLSSFMFELDYTKENIYLCELLANYIFHTNKKYKTKKELSREFKINYDMYMRISNFNVGKKLFVELCFIFLDPEIIKDDYLLNAIRFAHTCFFDLNVENGALDRDILNECKMKMINNTGSSLTNPSAKAHIEYDKRVLHDSIYTIDLIETKEEYEALLNSFTDKDIINMHKNLINNCFIGCNLMGNYKSDALDLIKELFVFNPRKLDTNYNSFLTFNEVEPDIEIKDDSIKQSTLIATYKIEDYKIADAEVYIAIEMALNYVGMLLHKTLREDLKLVYSADACFYKRGGFISLSASISKENKDKTLAGYNDVLKKLEDRTVIEDLLIKGKKEVELQNYIEDESYNRVFSRMIGESYKMRLPLKKQTEKYMNLTVDDILAAVKRIKLVNVFFYRGEK